MQALSLTIILANESAYREIAYENVFAQAGGSYKQEIGKRLLLDNVVVTVRK